MKTERDGFGINPETDDQIWLFMDKIEGGVIAGEKILIGESERLWLAEILTSKNIDLTVFRRESITVGDVDVPLKSCDTGKPVITLTAQTAYVEKALGGRKRLIEIFQKMIDDTTKNSKRDEAVGFVEKYFGEHDKVGLITYNESKDLLKCRLDAFVSSTHNLLVVLAQEKEENSISRQNDKYFLKFVRERIMRGWEKKKENDISVVGLSPNLERCNEKIVRSLPICGVGVIFRSLLA